MTTKDRFGNELSLGDKVLVPVYPYDNRFHKAVLKEGRICNITIAEGICVCVFEHPCYESFESKDVIKLPIGGTANEQRKND